MNVDEEEEDFTNQSSDDAENENVIDEEDENQSSDGSGNENEGFDGMADMMNKILHQNVDKKNPVLSKRKTAIMKEMEVSKEDKERLKALRMERKIKKERQLVVPDHATADYERQLRKLATRGVVALFNAIAKSKKEAAELLDEDKKIITSSKEKDSKISKTNFFDLLQISKENAGVNKRKEESTQDNNEKPSKTKKVEEEQKWSVLQEGLLLEKSLSLKNWDKEDDENEEDEQIGD